jgi:hypothetical protein
MPSKRGVAIFGVRAVVGIVGLAVGVAAVGAAALADWPTAEKPPPSVVVTPQPAEQQRVCPGPLLTLAEDSTQASAATSVGTAASIYVARAAGSNGSPITPDLVDIKAPDNADARADGSPLLLSVPAQPGVEAAPLVVGSQSQSVASETIGGLAVAGCAEATGSAWLVGGSTDVGHTSLVLLSNPSTVLATVSLTVYSETGQVDAPGSTGILVQPGTQRIVSLAGLAPNLKSPIVHVQSRGGQVAASLEESLVNGIKPGGVELMGQTAPAALEQTIAGLLVTAAPTGGAADSAELSDDMPSVRILVPGDAPATVRLGLTSDDGVAPGLALQFQVPPGIATEVPLTGITAGSFTVRLSSDQPIVAAARAATTGTASADFAWFPASNALTGDFLVAVAAGPSPTLHLHNPGDTDAQLGITTEDGARSAVTIPAGQSTFVALRPSARYSVTGGTSTIASVGYSGDGLLSSFALQPTGPLATPITVYAH